MEARNTREAQTQPEAQLAGDGSVFVPSSSASRVENTLNIDAVGKSLSQSLSSGCFPQLQAGELQLCHGIE